MRTSNIFSVIMYRFREAIDSNIRILRAYGVKLFLFSAVSSLFGEFIPIIGTYALAAYQFVFTKSLTVSAFSVVLASINSVKEATMRIAQNFETMSRFAYYFQNMREFLDFESKVANGTEKCEDFESLEFKNVYFRHNINSRSNSKGVEKGSSGSITIPTENKLDIMPDDYVVEGIVNDEFNLQALMQK